MTVLSLLIAFVVHSIIVVLLARRLVRWHVRRWLVLILAFTLFGTVIGLITMAIPSQFARNFVNPLGARLADWIHNSWYTAGLRPDNWESILPWVVKYPQVYAFASMVFGAIIGIILTLFDRFRKEKTNRLLGIDILPESVLVKELLVYRN